RPDEGIFGTRFSTSNYYDFDCVLLNPFGGRLLSPDGRKFMFMEDQKVVDATKWYLELVKAHATPYRGDMLENQDMFYAGKMVSNNTGLSGLVGIDAATDHGKLWEWGWTLVPLGPEGRGSQLFINQWCVGSTSEHPAAAYELISFLTSAEVGIWATVQMHKQPNGSRTAWYSKEVAEVEPAFAACAPWFEQENLQRFPMPWNLRFAELQDTWQNLTEALFYNEKTWDEVAPEVTKKCQEILDMPRP
ncbi:MAG: extracellular solute-binding protein, partial [Chloroflexi bacterium]|nr:extracellular solute-binding protein [Chloroflexota bacterium]